MADMTPQQRLDWFNKIGPRDAQRRKQVLDLVSRRALHSGQDFIGPNQGDKFTQDPYNRQLLPDSLRMDMCVPDQASQEQVLDLLKQGKEPPEPRKPPGC